MSSPELERIHEEFMRLYHRKDRHFKVLTFQEAKGMVGISYLKANERVSLLGKLDPEISADHHSCWTEGR